MNDVIERFAGDLRACRVDEVDVERTMRLYDRALVSGSDVTWRQFYRATFCALKRSAERVVARRVFAVESLLRLLGDDLGAALFEAGTIAQLGARLRGSRSVRPGVDQVQHRHRNVRAEGAIAVTFGHHADDRHHADDHYDD